MGRGPGGVGRGGGPFPGVALGQKELKSPTTRPLGGLRVQERRLSSGQLCRVTPALDCHRASEPLVTRTPTLSCPSPTPPACCVLAQHSAVNWPQHRPPFQAVSTTSYTSTNGTCVHPNLLSVSVCTFQYGFKGCRWGMCIKCFHDWFHLHCICAERYRSAVSMEKLKTR